MEVLTWKELLRRSRTRVLTRMGERPQKIPKLPDLVERKLYKSGQTRGADNDEIFQNRVGRNSTVLIPHAFWPICREPEGEQPYEKGYIVLIQPAWYFAQENPPAALAAETLELGTNALVFYQLPSDWTAHPPADTGWSVATSRLAPLGGEYIARVAATTAADGGERINHGFTTTAQKGAGIRVYEYASLEVIKRCRLQLEALLWMCREAVPIMATQGMTETDAEVRAEEVTRTAEAAGLLDAEALQRNRVINQASFTVCPLCLEELSPLRFVRRVAQAEGREVHDLTVTQVSLFHIEELRVGRLLHAPYNLGWGHHHCNVVAKDAGIGPTIEWMRAVLERNDSFPG